MYEAHLRITPVLRGAINIRFNLIIFPVILQGMTETGKKIFKHFNANDDLR